MSAPNPLAQAIISRHDALKAEQSNWRSLWDDAARYIMPRKGDILTKNTPGQEQTTQLYDTTAEESVQVFAAGLLAQLTPPGEAWFKLEPSKPGASEEYRSWLSGLTDFALKAIYASNFYLGWHEDCLDGGTFGTSCLYLEEGTKRLLNFVNIPVGTFTICEDAEGMVDTLYREWSWTAKQAEQQWGAEKLGEQARKALSSTDPKDWDRKFTFIHAIYPRRRGLWKEGQVEASLRPIASCYVCKEDVHVVEEGGFYEMPMFAGRLLRSNNEVYGRGPGVQVLPEIRVLNRMELDLLLAVETMVNPPWLMPDDSAYRPDNRPNGITYWDASNPNNKPEQLRRENRVDLGEQKTEQKRARIRSAFFVDMFQMLTNPAAMQREKTAFEVAQMVQERLVLFSPMFARIVQEKLNPLIERVVNIILRSGLYPPPPQDAVEQGYEISYTSKIALAIKAAQNNALLEVLNICTLMQPFDQAVGMVVDWAKALRDVARNRGLPQEWMRSEEDVQAMVAQMQQAQQAMQQAALAEQMGKTVKNLGPKAQDAAAKSIEVGAGNGRVM